MLANKTSASRAFAIQLLQTTLGNHFLQRQPLWNLNTCAAEFAVQDSIWQCQTRWFLAMSHTLGFADTECRHRCFYFDVVLYQRLSPALAGAQVLKQQKLTDFKHGLPHCTQASLSAILKKVKEEGIPQDTAPRTFREAERSLLSTMSLYGPLQVTAKGVTPGGTTQVLHVNLLSLLAGLYFAAEPFKKYMD